MKGSNKMSRHVLVTAGTKGLGRKVVETFMEKGYTVTTTYRKDDEKLHSLREKYSQDNLQLIYSDVTRKDDLKNLVEQAMRAFGRIDMLINNAGPYVFPRKKLVDYDDDEWDEVIEGNLSAVFHLLKLVIPIMRIQQFGRIINYGYQGAETSSGWLNRSAFAAAKAGLASLTKTIAYEEAENGITSNMVCPGDIRGELKEALIADAKLYEGRVTPSGRSATGEDIARVILFLCNEDSDMINGTVVEVSGSLEVIHRFRK